MKTHVVITTDYATGRVLAVYGPLGKQKAENLRMALPQSSTKDHEVWQLAQAPTFNFADKSGKRGTL